MLRYYCASILLLLVALVSSGDARRCYICNSMLNPSCTDPPNLYKLELTECTPGVMKVSNEMLAGALNGIRDLDQMTSVSLLNGPEVSYETPHCQKISFYFENRQVVVRGCQNKSPGYQVSEYPRTCQILKDKMYSQPDIYMDSCFTCDRDGCNSSPARVGASRLLAPLLTLVAGVAKLLLLR